MTKATFKVLFVDDEVNVLHGLKRQLYKNFALDLANSVDEAFEFIERNGPYAVIVSDMRMPDMSGTDFLQQVSLVAPQSVRMMLTGNADQETAAEAVNKAGVFHFLTKPCSSETMHEALNSAIDRYQVNIAEQLLLRQTLVSTIRLMTNVLSIVDPDLFGHISEIQNRVTGLASLLKVKNVWPLEAAAMLSQVLYTAIPEDVRFKLAQGKSLTPDEIGVMENVPGELRNLIGEIPRLGPVADIVYYCFKNADGSGFPEDGIDAKKIPGGAKIIRVLSDLQLLQKHSEKPALEITLLMREREDLYDKAVVSHLRSLIVLEDQKSNVTPEKIAAKELQAGDFLISDLRLKNDRLLLLGGQSLSAEQFKLLASNIESDSIAEPIFIARNSG